MLKRLITIHWATLNLGYGIVKVQLRWVFIGKFKTHTDKIRKRTDTIVIFTQSILSIVSIGKRVSATKSMLNPWEASRTEMIGT
jgi:hypothetical protein